VIFFVGDGHCISWLLNQNERVYVSHFRNRIFPLLLAAGLLSYPCKKETPMHTCQAKKPVENTFDDAKTVTAFTSTQTFKYYLALGDSYTIGELVNPAETFPELTVNKLNMLSLNFTRPEIIARKGWTTENLINALAKTPPLRTTYDVVSLLIGVNNQYDGLSQDQYKTEFIALLTAAIKLADNNPQRVFVLSIPDYSVAPFANGSNRELTARQIDEFNVINFTASKAAEVYYADITTSTREAAIDPSLIATDGLHPSAKEYYKWAQNLAPLINAALYRAV